MASGAAAACGPIFYAGVALSTAHLAWQVATVNLDNSADCLAKFKSNFTYGGIVTAGITLDKLYSVPHLLI